MIGISAQLIIITVLLTFVVLELREIRKAIKGEKE